MDTRKLATFVDLAQTKNYSKTAERIFFQIRQQFQSISWHWKRHGMSNYFHEHIEQLL